MKIKDIMTTDIACVDTKSTAADAAKKMKDLNVGSVLVIDQDKLQGLVTTGPSLLRPWQRRRTRAKCL